MKTLTRTFALALLALIIGLLTSCGGSGGSTGKSKPRVSIEWPSLTREIKAPTYAGSAVISITYSAGNSIPSYWIVDRPSGTQGQTISYQGPDFAPVGPAVLSVTFKTGTGNLGQNVAVASVSVLIDNDGNILNSAGGVLGSISYSSTLAGFSLNLADLSVGESTALVVTGYANSPFEPNIALPQDQVQVEIIDGNDHANLSDGNLVGVSEGMIQVQVSLDSITRTFPLTVIPRRATFHKIAFAANHVAWDPIHNRFWGSFGPNSAYPNSIVDISPYTGTIGSPIPVGSNPNQIAVSQDGTTAYVGIDGATSIRKVNLNSRAAGETIPLIYDSVFGAGTANALSIAVNPGNSNEIAVCLQSSGSSAFGGPVVFRDGLQIGPMPEIYTASKVAYLDSATLVGANIGLSPTSMYQISISLNDLTVDKNVQTGFSLGDNLSLSGSKVVFGNGYCFDGASFQQLGKITYGPERFTISAGDTTHDIAWSCSNDGLFPAKRSYIRAFDLTSFVLIDAVTIPIDLDLFEEIADMHRFGDTGLAVLSNRGMYFFADAPGLNAP